MSEVEKYLDWHPFRNWDRDKWDERDRLIDVRFHQPDIYYTPLVGQGLTMPTGVGYNQAWYTGAELLPAHINHNPIGLYQRMTEAMYVDTRQRKVIARKRWGAKAQWDSRDQLVTRWGNDSDGFLKAALLGQLGANIVGQMENVSRDGFIKKALHKFMWDGTPFELDTKDFSDIPGDETGMFNPKLLEQISLRMMTRSEYTRKAWGSYAAPVPGADFRSASLVMTSSGTLWGLEEQGSFLEHVLDLRQLQSERIINGGVYQYKRWAVFQDTGPRGTVLVNAGNIKGNSSGRQVAVTSPINPGDGAPDPDVTSVDGMFYAGQGHADVTHYVQCSDLDAADGADGTGVVFQKGDFVSIHIKRQGDTGVEDWGVTDGVDPLDGKTVIAEIYEVDNANNRLVFRDPITEKFDKAFDYDTLAGDSVTAGTAYAFITKAQDVHFTMVVGTRSAVQFVRRNQPDGSGFVQYHQPEDTNVDFPSIKRATANWHGEINGWDLDMYEIFFHSGPSANRGGVAWS